jgi:hypothetical protein
MIEIAEKLRPDQPDGTVSKDALAKYEETAGAFALKIANALEAKRKLMK